jgi:hypothetical protein
MQRNARVEQVLESSPHGTCLAVPQNTQNILKLCNGHRVFSSMKPKNDLSKQFLLQDERQLHFPAIEGSHLEVVHERTYEDNV